MTWGIVKRRITIKALFKFPTNSSPFLYKTFYWCSVVVRRLIFMQCHCIFVYNFRQRVIACVTQNWQNDISNASRGNHFKNYKSLLNTERYLQLEIPLKYKTAFTKFRCSNHKLNCEVGRQLHIAYNLRICNFCFTENNMLIIDCEYHAFFKCSKYDVVRREFLYNLYTG